MPCRPQVSYIQDSAVYAARPTTSGLLRQHLPNLGPALRVNVLAWYIPVTDGSSCDMHRGRSIDNYPGILHSPSLQPLARQHARRILRCPFRTILSASVDNSSRDFFWHGVNPARCPAPVHRGWLSARTAHGRGVGSHFAAWPAVLIQDHIQVFHSPCPPRIMPPVLISTHRGCWCWAVLCRRRAGGCQPRSARLDCVPR